MTRFTLRDVFWLTLVVGMALGWWMDHRWLVGNWNKLLWAMTNGERVIVRTSTTETTTSPNYPIRGPNFKLGQVLYKD